MLFCNVQTVIFNSPFACKGSTVISSLFRNSMTASNSFCWIASFRVYAVTRVPACLMDEINLADAPTGQRDGFLVGTWCRRRPTIIV